MNEWDIVIGIVVSGCIFYVIGVLRYVKLVKVKMVVLFCNGNFFIGKEVDYSIEVVVGLEVLIGFIRLKVVSVYKMIFNMIFIVVMIKVGKVYENLMIDVYVSNEKFKEWVIGIICKIIGVFYE